MYGNNQVHDLSQGFYLDLWPNLNSLLILSRVNTMLFVRSLYFFSPIVYVSIIVSSLVCALQCTILSSSSSLVCNVQSKQYCMQSIILLFSNSFQFTILPFSNNFQQYCLQSATPLFSNSLQYAILPSSNTFPNFLFFFLIFSDFFPNF